MLKRVSHTIDRCTNTQGTCAEQIKNTFETDQSCSERLIRDAFTPHVAYAFLLRSSPSAAVVSVYAAIATSCLKNKAQLKGIPIKGDLNRIPVSDMTPLEYPLLRGKGRLFSSSLLTQRHHHVVRNRLTVFRPSPSGCVRSVRCARILLALLATRATCNEDQLSLDS
jgi:hypothetical protein